ncbi:hypothetical protein BSLG_005197 [Batrachochytrium salamandrivorans]|nr:hypothetical protein BASA60_009946 [Batrachochytrium salamandrivorans]KAH6569502.1 hypothetical protein BASA62_004874 [Batrachochytrium salamandrivorans]KAH9252702.1 hypothetical protein BASA81_009396 [Batrachochytrium salamandrivorans]KAH9267496.1 hypothetical protein BASA83_009884 [Batrachochytrium salamandrivorans]KAJ1340204.1 hypothetical protein BSLG_005197 [Batrachochytrium salamandrivorans]
MSEAPDTVDDFIQSISSRIDTLELLVSPAILHASTVVPTDNPSATIIGGLKDAQRSLKRTLQDQNALLAFIQLYDSIEPLLATKQLLPGTLPPHLSDPILREMVLAADTELLEIAAHLKEIDLLKGHTDIPCLSDLPQLQLQLSNVEKKTGLSVDLVTRMHTQFRLLLAEYSEFNTYISQLFVHLHQVVSELEDQAKLTSR